MSNIVDNLQTKDSLSGIRRCRSSLTAPPPHPIIRRWSPPATTGRTEGSITNIRTATIPPKLVVHSARSGRRMAGRITTNIVCTDIETSDTRHSGVRPQPWGMVLRHLRFTPHHSWLLDPALARTEIAVGWNRQAVCGKPKSYLSLKLCIYQIAEVLEIWFHGIKLGICCLVARDNWFKLVMKKGNKVIMEANGNHGMLEVPVLIRGPAYSHCTGMKHSDILTHSLLNNILRPKFRWLTFTKKALILLLWYLRST